MPAPAYTDHEAAVHELGHAMVACALALDLEYVEIRPAIAPRNGWVGQCKPGAAFPKDQWVCLDAFQLGGPLLQMAMLPHSLGGHAGLFRPSLFTNAPDLLTGKFDVLNELVWGTDLANSYMLQMAPNAPQRAAFVRAYGEKPWLLALETQVRAFLALPHVHDTVNQLWPELVKHRKLAPDIVSATFHRMLAAAAHESLRELVAGHMV
jgi:hypothetical protein